MRRELFAAVSHDLRTPITSLGLLATAIDDEVVEDAKRREYAARMNTHVRALAALIDDLFDLTRLEAKELEWTMERLEVDAARPRRGGGDAPDRRRRLGAVHAELRPPLAPSLGNHEQLQRVLFNLIQNAIHHTPPDGSVTVRAEDVDGGVEIEVADTGSGIDPHAARARLRAVLPRRQLPPHARRRTRARDLARDRRGPRRRDLARGRGGRHPRAISSCRLSISADPVRVGVNSNPKGRAHAPVPAQHHPARRRRAARARSSWSRSCATSALVNDELRGRGRVGLRRRPARRRAPRPSCGTTDGETLLTDGPYVEAKEHIGGFTMIEAPDLDAALEWAGQADARGARRCPIEVRPVRGVRLTVRDRTCLPRALRPRGRRPGPPLRRHRRRRGGGPGRVHRPPCGAGRATACRRARPAGSSRPRATAAIDRLRREAARSDRARSRPRWLHPTTSPEEDGPGARRPAAADLHLLPPGARARRAGRAHAAAARRAEHGRDRARVPRARADDGAAARARQGARSATRGSRTACRAEAELPDAAARRCSPSST